MPDDHETENFMDELLAEAEQKENAQIDGIMDLVLLEIGKMENQIAKNFATTEEECKILNDWSLRKNMKLQERIDFLALKLESFIRERGAKTVDLAHGTLRIRKTPDRFEIDIEELTDSADITLYTAQPTVYKPNLPGIKDMIKNEGVVPDGVTVIEGTEKFSYKLKQNGDSKDGDTEQE